MATVTSIYRPFLVAGYVTPDRHSLGGAVIRMFDKTLATEKFPNLHPHGALNRANTVHSSAHELTSPFPGFKLDWHAQCLN